ncbi:glycosyl hydrolase [Lewinella sp. 4G2]|uniref:glycosyl hydrolase n=1 Tax=Lewinella sp. 4G2 TaxID=1803372 RepID=UPI0007B4EB04|nr:glycosyl hydrolase [Lewinella sp. 4G2]OAV44053.1 hypothetical protein A3850_005880 [Lewinella sp. 4G2]
MMRYLAPLLLLGLFACEPEATFATDQAYGGRPYARYWWFAQEMDTLTIKDNLDWLHARGFGGIELAFVYPLNRMDKRDTNYIPRDAWLGEDWRAAVDYTQRYATSLGMGCDLTGGSLWPFGDVGLDSTQASRKFGEPDYRQPITAHWEWPVQGLVVDHLTPAHYRAYFDRTYSQYPDPVAGQSYFVDSWEVETKGLWAEGFGDDFADRYGYRIEPFMDSLYADGRATQRYDYHELLSERVVDFYAGFTDACHERGVRSRGQASGAPADILSAYDQLDVPEGELLLYEPEYNRIPAAAAALCGKATVSAETFTCTYGWPRDFQRRAQVADLKLMADAAFANGINQIIWHGKPHSPVGTDSVTFYATVHLGDSSALAPHLPAFNDYLTTVSRYFQRGQTASRAAVYLPTEDAWRAGEMPLDQQFIWAWGHYEMRYVYPPKELWGYNPLWVNGEFLRSARVQSDGGIGIGPQLFDFLFVEVDYLSTENLLSIVELAESGGRVALRSSPQLAGTRASAQFIDLKERLEALPNVSTELPDTAPLVSAAEPFPYWSRAVEDTLYLFVAPRGAAGITFPLTFGQSYDDTVDELDINVNFMGNNYRINHSLPPYQSALFALRGGAVEVIDITYEVPVPEREELPAGHLRPWLVGE